MLPLPILKGHLSIFLRVSYTIDQTPKSKASLVGNCHRIHHAASDVEKQYRNRVEWTVFVFNSDK